MGIGNRGSESGFNNVKAEEIALSVVLKDRRFFTPRMMNVIISANRSRPICFNTPDNGRGCIHVPSAPSRRLNIFRGAYGFASPNTINRYRYVPLNPAFPPRREKLEMHLHDRWCGGFDDSVTAEGSKLVRGGGGEGSLPLVA